jgi:hypothetical protein
VQIDSDGVDELSDDVIAPIAESAMETIR